MADESAAVGSSTQVRRLPYVGWPMPLAVIWVIAPVVGILIRLSVEPVGPHDYWWSLAMGRHIADTGQLPAQNLFLYTLAADKPFVNQPWLSQWLMYVLVDGFGHVGPIVGRNVLAALSWAGVVWAALGRCDDPRVVGGLGLLAAAVSGPVFGVRTQMFAFLPYVGLVGVVFGVASGAWRRRWLAALVPLTALWANLHGTFMLAPVLVGLAGGSLVAQRWLDGQGFDGAEAGSWAAATAAVGAAAMVNPLGPRVYEYVFRLTFVSTVSETVTEWQPPDITTAFGAIFTTMLVASLAVLAIRRNKVRLVEAVLFAATAYLAVGAVRQMFWWAAVMLMVVPRHLADLLALKPWSTATTTKLQGVAHLAAAAVLVGASVASQPGLPVHTLSLEVTRGLSRRRPPARGVLSAQNPVGLVDRMARLGYPGRIFHDQAVGGLLEYRLSGPADKPVAFVDQRMELIPRPIWAQYFKVSAANPGWRAVLERYDIQTLLLWPEAQSRLIRAVQADPGWTLVGVGEGHVLFFDSAAADAITRWR